VRFARSYIELAELQFALRRPANRLSPNAVLNSSAHGFMLWNSISNLPAPACYPADASLQSARINLVPGVIQLAISADQFRTRRNRRWEPATQHSSGQILVREQLTLHHFNLSINDTVQVHLCAPSRLCPKSPSASALPPDLRRGCASPCAERKNLGWATVTARRSLA
jgi:hypothetical protein